MTDTEYEDFKRFQENIKLKWSCLPSKISFEQVVDKYCDSLPVLICVTDGIMGSDGLDFTLSPNDVYRISHVLTQRRVVCQSEAGLGLSFPCDHPSRFKISPEGKLFQPPSDAKSLQEIIDDGRYLGGETCITYVGTEESGNTYFPFEDRAIDLTKHTLQILAVYDETYLVGNEITEEGVYKNPTILPTWLPVQVNVVNGVKKGTESNRNLPSYKGIMHDLHCEIDDTRNRKAQSTEIWMVRPDDMESENYVDFRLSHRSIKKDKQDRKESRNIFKSFMRKKDKKRNQEKNRRKSLPADGIVSNETSQPLKNPPPNKTDGPPPLPPKKKAPTPQSPQVMTPVPLPKNPKRVNIKEPVPSAKDSPIGTHIRDPGPVGKPPKPPPRSINSAPSKSQSSYQKPLKADYHQGIDTQGYHSATSSETPSTKPRSRERKLKTPDTNPKVEHESDFDPDMYNLEYYAGCHDIGRPAYEELSQKKERRNVTERKNSQESDGNEDVTDNWTRKDHAQTDSEIVSHSTRRVPESPVPALRNPKPRQRVLRKEDARGRRSSYQEPYSSGYSSAEPKSRHWVDPRNQNIRPSRNCESDLDEGRVTYHIRQSRAIQGESWYSEDDLQLQSDDQSYGEVARYFRC